MVVILRISEYVRFVNNLLFVCLFLFFGKVWRKAFAGYNENNPSSPLLNLALRMCGSQGFFEIVYP